MPDDTNDKLSRRDVLKAGARGVGFLAVGGMLGYVAKASAEENLVWQIDPLKCTACGNCATHCVLEPSASKCVHAFSICGYCELCFGYFDPEANTENPAAENQLCPVNAISRKRVTPERPYYEYLIDEELCVACGKCIQGCAEFGNGSLHLQLRHDRCLNCNECAIAEACPADAFVRVPASEPYLMKDELLNKPVGERTKEGEH